MLLQWQAIPVPSRIDRPTTISTGTEVQMTVAHNMIDFTLCEIGGCYETYPMFESRQIAPINVTCTFGKFFVVQHANAIIYFIIRCYVICMTLLV